MIKERFIALSMDENGLLAAEASFPDTLGLDSRESGEHCRL
jgi:hypothetical protein